MQFGERRPMPPSLPSYDYGQAHTKREAITLAWQTLLVIALGMLVGVVL